MSNKSGTSSQAITLPTGGGALSGIGETFSADPFTGTGTFSVPIAVPSGRNNFQPSLTLSYGTGDGNGPFGLGWSVSVPSVTRRTSHGVPRYGDADTFVLSGSEELVPVAEPEPGVTRFRPRTEGPFALIDRRPADGDRWRVATKDGLVSTYGAGPEPAVVADPADRSKVLRWMLSETTDPFGNRIVYDYRRDTGTDGPHDWDQLYLERIRYVDYDDDGETRFLVSVTFVYEERPDAFSDHRPGFEVRTRLRCRRIEIRTHADEDLLSRTYELTYLDDLVRAGERTAAELARNGVSLLARITVVGHDGARTEALPPLDFGYTRFDPDRARFQQVEADGDALPPTSLAADGLETVDLTGNGLPDIVHLDGTAMVWRNLGGGRFARPQPLTSLPGGIRLADAGVQVADMDGDGRADLLTLDRHGYFPLALDGAWHADEFVEYPTAPNVTLGADDLRLVDLDGDGVVDALRTGAQFELFFNDPRRGWDRVETVPRRPLAEFPDVTFSDPRVKLADLDGDGLQDIVLVEQGRIVYWPYLGNGRWGRRVTMDDSPRFRDDPPFPSGFDPRRVLFGDLDGDGLDDVVYVGLDRVTCWINRGGGAWGNPIEVDGTPSFTDIDGVRLTDLLGTGMSGALWTADAQPGAGSPYRFLDLTAGHKPYLLETMDNNMGTVTKVSYAPSTTFHLADAAAPATRWSTCLPFPVHVVERVEAIDEISGGRLTTAYRYHDGHWDGLEREFRGFGMVEQVDTETGPATPLAAPLLTKRWFHLGPVGEEFEDWREQDRSGQFWPEDPAALGHVEGIDATLRALPTRRARRDGLRALHGRLLRTEVYELDGSAAESRPLTITDHAYELRREDPAAAGESPPVFFPHLLAERTTHWDRGTDPLTTMSFTDGYDAFGQPTVAIAVAVPRGRDHRREGRSGEPYLATVTTTTYALGPDHVYVADRVTQTTTQEVANDGSAPVLSLRDAVVAGTGRGAVIGQTNHYYDGEPNIGLPPGRFGPFGALVRSESLVLTEDLLEAAYGDAIPPYLGTDGEPAWTPEYPDEFREGLASGAGYSSGDGTGGRSGGLFADTLRRTYDTQTTAGAGRGLVVAERDAAGVERRIDYDRFGLLPTRITDPAGLSTVADHDDRTLRPRLVVDVNGNRTAVEYTPLGLVASVANMAKANEAAGDTVDEPGVRYAYDLTPARTASGARRPVSVRTTKRIHHVRDLDVPDGERNQTIEVVEFSDGFGRIVQSRLQGDDLRFGDDAFGAGVLPAGQDDPGTGTPVVGWTVVDPTRPPVVVSGARVYDNKGRTVERYEPYFAAGWDYEPPSDEQTGHHVTLVRDGRGRIARAVHADGAEDRVVYGLPGDLADPEAFTPSPWHITTYDRNDNAGRTHAGGARGYRHHWDTPITETLDALGRVTMRVERSRPPADGGGPLPAVEEVPTALHHDLRGNVVSVVDAFDRPAFRHVYDLSDRVVRTESVDAGTHWAVLDAAGREVERRDVKGAVVLTGADTLGRPSRVWARDRHGDAVTLRQRIEYGDAGDPRQLPPDRDAARAANLLGRPVRHYDEAGLLTTVACDLHGNVVDQRRTTIAPDLVAAAFDSPPQTFQADWTVPAGGTIDDRAAQLLDSTTHTTSTRHDALDRPRSVGCSDAATGTARLLAFRHGRSGDLAGVTLDGRPVVEHVSSDPRGRPTLMALANGVMIRHAYDPRTARLARTRCERYLREEQSAATYRPTGDALHDVAHAHDLVGNTLTLTDRTAGSGVAANPQATTVTEPGLRTVVAAGDALVRRFTYDPLYRLTAATGRAAAGPGTASARNASSLAVPYREQYRYDRLGNLTRQAHVGAVRAVRTFDIEPASNRLAGTSSGSSAVAFAHDPCGNVVREGGSRHFHWDHANRMSGFRIAASGRDPSVEAQYLYDASGARVLKVVRDQGGAVSASTYIGGYAEHHRFAGADGELAANTRIHIAVGDQRVACSRTGTPHPDDQGPDDQFLLADNLGSVAVVLDDHGELVNREEYTPFGETSLGSFGRKRFRFNGKERDEESGLYFHGARSYAPWLARWASADPRGPVDGLNLYRFARDNPLRFTDPDGTQARDEHERTTGTAPTASTDAARRRLTPPPEPDGKGVVEAVDKLFGTADLPVGSLMGEPLSSDAGTASSIVSNKFALVGGLVALLTKSEPHEKVQGALGVLEGGLGVAGTIAAESGAVVAGSRLLLASEGFGLLGLFIMPYVEMGESRKRAFDQVKAENYRGGFLLGFAAGATGADADWVRKELLIEVSPFAHSSDIGDVGTAAGNRGIVDGYLSAVKLPAADREAYVNAVIDFAARHRRTWNGFADDYTNVVRGLARDTPEALGLRSGRR